MKITFMNAVLIIAFQFSMFSVVCADEALQYELTPKKVKSAWVAENAREYYVFIVEVKERYRNELSQLTGNNIGRRLEVIYSREIFYIEVIKTRNSSGIIVSTRE